MNAMPLPPITPTSDPNALPERYLPALSYQPLTRYYDTVLRWTMREDTFKRRLVAQATIGDAHRVLDLGCGTGTLTLSIKQQHPGAFVAGIDPDREVLDTAGAKAAHQLTTLSLARGSGTRLPYAGGTFDRALTSLMLHHLTTAQKRQALSESYRVLRPGGELHVADWGRASNPAMRAAFLLVQFLDGFETTADNVRGRLPSLIRDAGFIDVRETATYTTLFGSVTLLSARKPGTNTGE